MGEAGVVGGGEVGAEEGDGVSRSEVGGGGDVDDGEVHGDAAEDGEGGAFGSAGAGWAWCRV